MKNNKKGFTLVELVIVVAVMAVLVAVAIPTVGSIVGTAKKNVLDTNAQTIESMIKLAQAENDADSMNAAAVGKAIVEAKLGITEGTFYYNAKTGAVTTTKGTDLIEIKFAATTVTVGGTAYNLDGSTTPAPSEPSTPAPSEP